MKSIYVSLPVKDLEASTQFISKVFEIERVEALSNDAATLLPLNPIIFVALMTEKTFTDHLKDGAAATPPVVSPTAVESMLAVTVDSREQVEEILARALELGGQPWTGVFDMGDSHCATFLDLDGHVWEVIHHPNAFWEGVQA